MTDSTTTTPTAPAPQRRTAKQKKPRPKRVRFSHTGCAPNEDRRQAVAALYQSGMSIRAVGELVGVSPQAVHSMLERMNIERRPRGGNQGGHSRHAR